MRSTVSICMEVWVKEAWIARDCCSNLMTRYCSLILLLRRLRERALNFKFCLFKTKFLSILLILMIVLIMRWNIWLTWSWLSTIKKTSWGVSSELMMLIFSCTFAFTFGRGTARIRVLWGLLTYCLVVYCNSSSSSAVTWELLIANLCTTVNWSSFALNLIETLLSVL